MLQNVDLEISATASEVSGDSAAVGLISLPQNRHLLLLAAKFGGSQIGAPQAHSWNVPPRICTSSKRLGIRSIGAASGGILEPRLIHMRSGPTRISSPSRSGCRSAMRF